MVPRSWVFPLNGTIPVSGSVLNIQEQNVLRGQREIFHCANMDHSALDGVKSLGVLKMMLVLGVRFNGPSIDSGYSYRPGG